MGLIFILNVFRFITLYFSGLLESRWSLRDHMGWNIKRNGFRGFVSVSFLGLTGHAARVVMELRELFLLSIRPVAKQTLLRVFMLLDSSGL